MNTLNHLYDEWSFKLAPMMILMMIARIWQVSKVARVRREGTRRTEEVDGGDAGNRARGADEETSASLLQSELQEETPPLPTLIKLDLME